MLNKRVLLLYYYYHHHQMVEYMAASMLDYGVGVDVLCMDNLRMVRNSDLKSGGLTMLLLRFFEAHNTGIVYRVVRKLFAKQLLKSLMRQYDLMDFHAFAMAYIPYMQYCVQQGKPYDITLWGSDIMRASAESIAAKRYGFAHCRCIKASENLQVVVEEKYPGLFGSKFKTVYWGNNDFEVIDRVRLSYDDVAAIKESFLPDAGEKTIVTLGYNGSKGQNHGEMLAAIDSLPAKLKGNIYLLLPLTYGATEEYLREVESKVKRLNVLYTIYAQRIPVEDIAKIRLVSDVVVNMQDTDAFSGSLQDHLYCNNLLVIGEWLNYIALDNVGMYYIKTSYESLPENITKVLIDLTSYKQKCEDNYIKMKQLTSWKCVLLRWAETYKS